MIRHPHTSAFTLAEVMIAMVGSLIVLGALLLSSTQLQRALYSSERYATSQTDQRRLIDYLGRDLRRAIGLSTTTSINGSGGTPLTATSVALESGTSLVITLPGYYLSEVPSDDTYDESLPVVVANNYVDYGTEAGHAPGVRVIFRKEYVDSEGCECFVRLEGESRFVIVRGTENIHLEVGLSPDGRLCQIAVSFTPAGRSLAPRVSTHDQILMRNIRTD